MVSQPAYGAHRSWMIPRLSLMGGSSREHSRLAKASVENIILLLNSGRRYLITAVNLDR